MDDIEDAYPLSHTQLGMLFHSERERRHSVYHDIVLHTIRLPLEYVLLQEILDELLLAHEVLRTRFRIAKVSRPLQIVQKRVELKIEVVDLAGLTPQAQSDAQEQWIEAEKSRGFDLTRAPLLRMSTFTLCDRRFVLGISIHHAIIDGWSLAQFVSSLVGCYARRLRGEPAQIARPKRRYREYIALEHEAVASESSRSFWQDSLRDLSVTRLPRLASPGESKIDRTSIDIPDGLDRQLRRMSASMRIPIKTVLLAAHIRALAALSGQSEVVTGVVTNGRPEAQDGEAMLGLFLNTVPMRVRMMEGGRWRELIAQVFALERQVWPHRRYPLALMQREQGGTTLFDCIFNYTHFHNYRNQFGSDEAPIVDARGIEHSNYPLVVQAMQLPDSGALCIVLQTDRELYAATHVEQMAQVYQAVLEAMAEDVEARYDARAYISGATRDLMLRQWNATQQSYPSERLDELFASQVDRTPQAIAVEDGEAQLTYQQLDERSEVIARQLSGLGVGAGTRVGVSMDRWVGSIEVLLGIVKAGGAYVPLDRSYPAERLRYLSADAGVSVVVSEERESWLDAQSVDHVQYVVGRLQWRGRELEQRELRGSRTSMSRDASTGTGMCTDTGGRTGASSAYVMYTSGSTGEPKGVVVSDRGIVRLVRQSNYLSIGEQDVLLQLAPVSFDASTLEIWGALLNGARLVMAPRGRVSLSQIGELIQRHQVSVLWLTAPLFHLMVDESLEGLRGVHSLLAGGDALSVTHVQKYLSQPWAGELINGYGPTEATTFSCCHVMRQWESGWSSVPIGTPITNSTAYVLDEQLQLVPIGTPGELYVGGAGVAQGYWGRARLTAERFVPDEYSQRAGARLYRTGDRVRYLADGRLEFLGRMDEQLKVRGYRIEPGEIEQALRQHEGVRDAAVVAREVNEATKQLVAYVVGEVSGTRLQSYLRERLPEYLVPSIYVPLEHLPLTVNGKIDRDALPEPQVEASEGTAYSAPQGATEEALSQIWSEVLRVAQVGRDDNFFELGGDSILSIQIKARAQEQSIDFALEDLFELQTIARLTAAIEGGRTSATASTTPTQPFELIDAQTRAQLPADVEDAYPATHMQLAMLYHSTASADRIVYQDVVCYELALSYEKESLQQALDALIERNEILRTSFDIASYSQPLQLVHSPQATKCDVLEGVTASEELGTWFDAEQRKSLPWSVAPLMRLTIHAPKREQFTLALTFHHAILDGWSEAALVRDLIAIYQAKLRRQSLEPSRLTVAYRDFVKLELAAIASAECEAYWRQAVRASGSRLLELKGHDAQSGDRQVASLVLAARSSFALHQLSRQLGVPLKAVLLAVHAKVLATVSGSSDVVTGVTVNGRPEVEGGEQLLGLFINTIPMHFSLRGESWAELIQQAFEIESAALPHRRVPLQLIARRAGVRLPFEVIFNYTHFHHTEGVYRKAGGPVSGRYGYAATEMAWIMEFTVRAGDGDVSGHLVFDADRLSDARARQVVDIYHKAIESLLRDPHTSHNAASLVATTTPRVERRTLARRRHANVISMDDAQRQEGSVDHAT